MTRYRDLKAGIERLQVVIGKQCQCPIPSSTPTFISRSLMRLSDSECDELCGGFGSQQLVSSRHLIVQSNDRNIYKIIYLPSEKEAFTLYMNKDGVSNHLVHPQRVIMPTIPTLTVYKYKHLPFSPLNQKDACKCLRSLVVGLRQPLQWRIQDFG